MPVWIFQEADARRESWGCVPVKEEPETEKEECDGPDTREKGGAGRRAEREETQAPEQL